MSIFGDDRQHMNYLYDDLEEFVENGGTIAELFGVLEWFFKDHNKKLKEEEKDEKN